ncbi:MAG: ATP-binding protein [Lewinellaceae bacterium]|nr:ATP-binding protein [Phaeodactylibacter sp.]MCB0612699.1 ATP-binding protein [Phaeodactylibacter sp.]MCB9347928.1 ATP-binding protein [Lewinellaceae bacterium]
MIQNPFKFLESYDKEDKDRFFGRERETAQLYNAVHASNLILLYGASGTGKTSLVNCGLANQFHDTDWMPIFVRRGNNLNQSLRRELGRLLPGNDWTEDTSIRHRVQELHLDYYRPVYLIFDQFEELYIMGGKTEQDAFHQTVDGLLKAGLQCKILLIIREEYIAYLSEFEKVAPPLYDNRLRIEKMNDHNLARVVSGTCRYGGITVVAPKNTVPAILDNLRSQREGIDLTNLQVYLDRLWRKDIERQQKQRAGEPEQVTFDHELVAEVGPMQNVLSDFLDEQLAEVEQGLRRRGVNNPEGIPLEVLFTLVTEDGTKRNMVLENIVEAMPRNRRLSPGDVSYCMEAFERIKLLRRFAD